jgi:TolB-like protein
MKKMSILSLIVTVLVASFVSLSSAEETPTVAVVDFEDYTNSGLGPQLAEFFRTGLIGTGSYDVIERAQLEKVLKEQAFTMTDLTDPSTAAEIGKILGADYIAVGSLTKLGNNWIVNARLLDVNTAKAAAGAQASGGSENDLLNMMNELVTEIVHEDLKTETGRLVEKPLLGNVIFKDNFENGLNPPWIITSNDIPITPGFDLITIGSGDGASNDETDFGIDGKDWPDDYSIEFEFKILRARGNSYVIFNPIYSIRNEEGYVSCSINDGRLIIYTKDFTGWEKEYVERIIYDQRYIFKMDRKGPDIYIYLDDNKILSKEAVFISADKKGIRFYSNDDAIFILYACTIFKL